MDFLEKLNHLMKINSLNKSTLSKACDIPYTTIDGWYKKGYEGLKLTTLRKLSAFFGTSLDYWASESSTQITAKLPLNLTAKEETVIIAYRNNREMQPAVDKILGIDTPEENIAVFRAARSDTDISAGEVEIPETQLDKLKSLPAVTSDDEI